jgi:hypothetical protein
VIINWTDSTLQATIRYVSVSDPAPLPRLGEVFFDVRGNSRSMRLSWYADTGVAVFSIWQAGMCTGTFRLPMADLSRMIGILERGPAPKGRGRPPVSASRQDEDRRSDPGDSDWYYGPGGDEPARPGAGGSPGGYGADPGAQYGRPGRGAERGRGERGPADYGAAGYGQGGASDARDEDFDAGYEPAGGYQQPGYGGRDHAEDPGYYAGGYGPAGESGGDDYPAQGYRAADYGRDEFAADAGYGRGYEQAGYEQAGYEQSGYEQPGYEQPGYEQPGYEQPGYEQSGYEQAGYEQAGYEQSGYAGPEVGYRTGEYSGYPEERRGGPDRGYAESDDSGYRDERFIPPYRADGGQTYPNDIPAPGGGYPGDTGDTAYPADRRPVSRSERYPEPPPAEEAYSNGAEYRYR